jgi:hypothetical protein
MISLGNFSDFWAKNANFHGWHLIVIKLYFKS